MGVRKQSLAVVLRVVTLHVSGAREHTEPTVVVEVGVWTWAPSTR